MYPLLKNCRVRGVEGDFFLHQFKKNEEFSLEKIHAEILWNCDGSQSLSQISRKFSQPKKDLLFFFNVLKEKGLLVFISPLYIDCPGAVLFSFLDGVNGLTLKYIYPRYHTDFASVGSGSSTGPRPRLPEP